jgi:hypothetical protein
MKICPVGAELFHPDGQTDMMKLIVPSRNFANAPKQQTLLMKIEYLPIKVELKSRFASSSFPDCCTS